VHPCGPAQGSSESEPIYATPAAGNGWPLTPERMIYDKGPHMASKLYKRAEDLLDYCIDLRGFLEPGETVASASATFAPLTAPALALPLLESGPSNVIVWLDGGKNAQSYQISVFVTTSGGRQKLFRFFVRVRGDAAIHTVAPTEGAPANVCAGVGPNLILSTYNVTFPNTPAGQSSEPIAVTVTNAGSERATISAIVVSDEFSYTSDTGGTVPGGESFTLWVAFHPTGAGTVGGYVAINGNSPVDLVLLAQGV